MIKQDRWTLATVAATIVMTCPAMRGAIADAGGAGPYFYSYYKQPIPLTLDAGRIAVFVAPGIGEDGRGEIRNVDLGSLGIPAADVTPWAVAGWMMAEVPAESRNHDGVRNLLVRIAAERAGADVDFVSPVLLDEYGPVIVTPTLLVGFNEDVTAAQALAALQQVSPGAVLDVDYARMKNVYRYRSELKDGLKVLEVANTLALRPDVIFAEPNMFRTVKPASIPDDPHFFRQWGWHNTGQNTFQSFDELCCPVPCTGLCVPPCPICGPVGCDDAPGGMPDFDSDVPEAWDLTSGDPDVIVAVFDQWVQVDHPDLGFDPALQADFTGQPVVCDAHGTPVAGVIGAKSNNGIGGAGVAPSCRVACARVWVASCNGGQEVTSTEWIIGALTWAQDIGARVTNHSYGLTTSATPALTTKFEQTRAAGLIHFASVGNLGQPFASYPASLDGTVNCISGLTSTGFWSEPFGPGGDSSSYGSSVEFSAPALLVWTTDVQGDVGAGYYGGQTCNDYFFWYGTSFASPHAAGVAALVLSVNPSLSPAQVEQIMRDSAVDYGAAGWDPLYGWGFVNAFNAVTLAQGTLPTPGDINGDGHVDGNDLAIVLGAWGWCSGCAADINNDDVVDGNDLAIVLGAWTG